MISFFISIGIFLVLVSSAGVWQYRQRKDVKIQTAQLDQEIARSAEVAQRRHVQRFGRASTDIERTFASVAKKS